MRPGVKLFVRPAGSNLELQAGERPFGAVPTDINGFRSAWLELVTAGRSVRGR